MFKETIDLYICQYCGQKHQDENWMKLHEEICALNPKNQPCAMCENQILGVGCSKNMDMESIGGNVLCFFYKKGYPKNPFDIIRININNNDGGEKKDE